MAQDYAKQNAAKKTQHKKNTPTRAPKPENKPSKRKSNTRKTAPTKKPPFWLWVFIGLCLLGFALFLSKLSSNTPEENPSNSNATPTNNTASIEETKNTEKESAKESQVSFDFYEILKGKEVEVDTTPIVNANKPSNVISWLQAASFRNLNDANSLRAKLILLNLDVSIESSMNKQQQEWYRVMVGPFASRSKLAKARSILASNNINSLVIKRKATP